MNVTLVFDYFGLIKIFMLFVLFLALLKIFGLFHLVQGLVGCGWHSDLKSDALRQLIFIFVLIFFLYFILKPWRVSCFLTHKLYPLIFGLIHRVLPLTEKRSLFLTLKHKPAQTLFVFGLELLCLKDLSVKIMNHILRVPLKVKPIDIQIKYINFGEEQSRGVVHNDAYHLVTVVGFFVWRFSDRLQGTQNCRNHVVNNVYVHEDHRPAHRYSLAKLRNKSSISNQYDRQNFELIR